MKLAKTLKLKNKLAGEISQLKELLAQQNSLSKKQAFDWCRNNPNRMLLTSMAQEHR